MSMMSHLPMPCKGRGWQQEGQRRRVEKPEAPEGHVALPQPLGAYLETARPQLSCLQKYRASLEVATFEIAGATLAVVHQRLVKVVGSILVVSLDLQLGQRPEQARMEQCRSVVGAIP